MSDPEVASDDRVADFRAIVKRADAGDQAALPIVKQMFTDLPALWDAYGNLATRAENAMIGLIAGKSVLTREAVRKKVASIRGDLAGSEASPLERLLVERVGACWLQAYQADLAYARGLIESSPAEVEHLQRRQDRAGRQYLRALGTLATVRRLVPVPMQVNIAERQVNIAGQTISVERSD